MHREKKKANLILKDIRFALGHVYYRSLASFLSFILLIFSRQKINTTLMNAQRKIKRQTLSAPEHVFYGLKVSPKGQLISKGLFGIPSSPKNERKNSSTVL